MNDKTENHKLGYVFLFVVVLSIVEIMSRTILKRANERDDALISWRVGLSTILYIGVIILLFYSMDYGKFITVSALWDSGTIILGALSSYFILQETVSTGEWIGIGLITLGVIVMSIYT